MKKKETYSCSFLVSVTSQTVCKGSPIKVSIINNLGTNVNFQLIDATTNNLVVSNLYSLNANNYSNNTFNVNLPSSIPAGTYKIKGIESGGFSSTSESVITITNAIAPAPLTISATPSTINGNTSVNVSASACSGSYLWNYNYSTSQSVVANLNNGYKFTVTCNDLNGCVSQEATKIVPYYCGDSYEPNDIADSSKLVHGEIFTSTEMCLGYNSDQDWFAFFVNGRKYYAMIKYFDINFSNAPINFFFKKALNNNVLTLQTYAVTSGNYIDTYLYLYDANMVQIAQNDDSNGNGLSKIIYNLTNNCQSNVELFTSEYDIYPDETSKIRSSNSLNASIKIKESAKSTFEAQNYILLHPGF